MLQLKNITKQYKTGGLVQKALDGVCLNLRANEFVAVLGPSGSGKTTLLNIIGGLDRYDSGDLVINGISTKKYADRDWDTYRNHTIGFVFQNYNLIPHQSVLSNVELTLTMAGISGRERAERAKAALEKVGLGDQLHKKPGQMSGGQMQRVAIARALVNDPDILLADEPTGALDSETSVQVMDLLKEVAKDRLVVMVTHNPDLAETYATRIVNLHDGQVVSDTDPFEIRDETAEMTGAAAEAAAAGAAGAVIAAGAAGAEFAESAAAEELMQTEESAQTADSARTDRAMPKRQKHSSMSFATAMSLSLNNLWTKKTRTLLTAIAGSIGIIGIALILSVSNGANNYVADIEAETMAEYPIQIAKTSLNFSAMFTGSSGSAVGEEEEEEGVRVNQVLGNFLQTMDSNDLSSLKEYLDSGTSGMEEYASSVEYLYSVTPQIYRVNEDGSVHQINPDQSFEALGGITSLSSSNSLVSTFLSSDVFFQMPADEELYEDQYDVLAGRWPENYNECVLVLSASGAINDWLIYSMGLRDQSEFDEIMQEFLTEEEMDIPESIGPYSYEEVLGITFKVVDSTDYYVYDEENELWVDKSEDEAYVEELCAQGEDLTVVGIVQISEDASGAALSEGINYPASLITHIAEKAAESEIVQQQLENPEIDVFTGEPFSASDDSTDTDLASLFEVDEDVLSEAFSPDTDALGDMLTDSFDVSDSMTDLLGEVDYTDFFSSLTDLSTADLQDIFDDVEIDYDQDALEDLLNELLDGYNAYAKKHPEADYSSFADDFSAYLGSDEAKTILTNMLLDAMTDSGTLTVSSDAVEELLKELLSGYMTYASEQGYTDWSDPDALLNAYLKTEDAQTILAEWTAANLTQSGGLSISSEELQEAAAAVFAGYQSYAAENDLFDPTSLPDYISDYLQTKKAQKLLKNGITEVIDTDSLQEQIMTAFAEEMGSNMESAMSEAMETQIGELSGQIADQLAEGISEALVGSLSIDSLSEVMDFDTESLLAAFGLTGDSSDLLDLLTSLSGSDTDSYDNNLETLGYADFSDPNEINIYPIDFESKEQVEAILDDYNARMEAAGEDGKVVSYTDTVGTMMSSVTEIINVISYVLIAFVAIALVVSSIMIGVITHISVLERRKEIGILRAIGASRRNISQVFNAETFIIGLAAGILGIIVTVILQLPINYLIHSFTGSTEINTFLAPWHALILIALSVALTLISGLLPARKAAKSDPVEALRSE